VSSVPRPLAVLDTSFWTVGFKAGVLGYALKLYRIVVPRQVEQEIRIPDRRYPQRVYPDTALFDEVRHLLLSPPTPEPPAIARFGAGEAAAIPLAETLNATLLINDRRPAEYARGLGIRVTTLPGLIVLARSRDYVATHVAEAMLRTCTQHGTSPALVQEASLVLSALLVERSAART
jgi:predicted nucleic acid-binding protein